VIQSFDSHAPLFQLLLDSMPNAVLLVDATGRITYANPLAFRYFGYAPHELIGMGVEVLVPAVSRAGHASLRTGYLREPRMRAMTPNMELYAQRKDGSTFSAEIGLSPIESAEGMLVLATINDISELKRTTRDLMERTRELARSNTELEQFAYVASHDLQEPLRMVTSYLQLIAQRYEGRLDADADDFIRFAVDGATRMKQLIKDLLDYSRAGRSHTEKPVALAHVLERVLGSLGPRITETNAHIVSDPLPRVLGDEGRLFRMFLNLVSNAIKFRRPDSPPEVHIGARRQGREWIIEVADNGIGIGAEYKERIFQMFQRLHGRDEYEGTGIGLATCKRIVERHGGHIWVESQAGRGSTFFVSLPAVRD